MILSGIVVLLWQAGQVLVIYATLSEMRTKDENKTVFQPGIRNNFLAEFWFALIA
jgi:hypothetical protein